MKKITLAVFAAFSSFSMAYSQSTLTIEAPTHNTNYIDLLPMGASTEATLNAIYLANASELGALTGTAMPSMGIQIFRGLTGTLSVSGNFTLYLQNTTDVTYNKGTTFTTALNGMTNAYSGVFTVPASQASSTVNLVFPQTFTYTNGGLYVGIRWESVGPFNTGTTTANFAAYPSNSGVTGTNMGAIEEIATGSVATTMSPVEARPSFLFRVVNGATAEAGVTSIIAPGKVAKSVNAGHIISALVKNSSVNTMSNITVSLSVGGANTFANTQNIASLAAGATATVNFASFNPTTMGVNHVSVSVAPDQNNTNNLLVWTQSVTCNVMGNNPPDAIASFTGAVGFPNGSGIFSTQFVTGNAATLTAVRISVSSDADNIGKQLYGVVMDVTGNIIAASDTLVITSALNNNFQAFRFRPGQALAANTPYLIGLAQPESGHYPMAYEPGSYITPGQFFASPITGGSFNNSNFGYFGIEPVLGPDVSIDAPLTSTICLGDSFTLTADGAGTYTWSAVPNTTANTIATPNATSIAVAPTRTGTITYTLKGTDGAGCVNSTTVSAKVALCTGIASNFLNEANIKLYPNPAVNGKSTISGLEGSNTITVYNILGQAVLTKNTTDETVSIDLTTQPTGNYLVRITDTSNHSKTIKIINQN